MNLKSNPITLKSSNLQLEFVKVESIDCFEMQK